MIDQSLFKRVYRVIEEAVVEQIDMEDLGMSTVSQDHSITQDLGVDSVDFLNILYDIESNLDIKIPFREWVENSENNSGYDAFTLRNFTESICKLMDKVPS